MHSITHRSIENSSYTKAAYAKTNNNSLLVRMYERSEQIICICWRLYERWAFCWHKFFLSELSLALGFDFWSIVAHNEGFLLAYSLLSLLCSFSLFLFSFFPFRFLSFSSGLSTLLSFSHSLHANRTRFSYLLATFYALLPSFIFSLCISLLLFPCHLCLSFYLRISVFWSFIMYECWFLWGYHLNSSPFLHVYTRFLSFPTFFYLFALTSLSQLRVFCRIHRLMPPVISTFLALVFIEHCQNDWDQQQNEHSEFFYKKKWEVGRNTTVRQNADWIKCELF